MRHVAGCPALPPPVLPVGRAPSRLVPKCVNAERHALSYMLVPARGAGLCWQPPSWELAAAPPHHVAPAERRRKPHRAAAGGNRGAAKVCSAAPTRPHAQGLPWLLPSAGKPYGCGPRPNGQHGRQLPTGGRDTWPRRVDSSATREACFADLSFTKGFRRKRSRLQRLATLWVSAGSRSPPCCWRCRRA